MWPLLLISITSLACIFERIAYWKDVIKKNDSKLMITVEKYANISSVDFIKQNDYDDKVYSTLYKIFDVLCH